MNFFSRPLKLEQLTLEHSPFNSLDLEPYSDPFLQDVLEGLQRPNKSIPSKYLYDERGSQLFDEICELDEYYLTRAESQIMETHGDAMAKCMGSEVVLVELGSGNSQKTRILLDHLHDPIAYLPVDVSASHLSAAADQIQREYTSLAVHPLECDFTTAFEIPSMYRSRKVCIYFPGSTIGNLGEQAATELLARMRTVGEYETCLLIGFDLQKDPAVLLRAYDDSLGVTAQFTLNLLHRINCELNADFEVSGYRHRAQYNQTKKRIEIFIESLRDQTVHVAGRRFDFHRGELLHTEYSHKYTLDGFADLARTSGFQLQRVWQDHEQLFAVAYLTSLPVSRILLTNPAV